MGCEVCVMMYVFVRESARDERVGVNRGSILV